MRSWWCKECERWVDAPGGMTGPEAKAKHGEKLHGLNGKAAIMFDTHPDLASLDELLKQFYA